MQDGDAHIIARDITIAYGDFVVQRDLNFTVNRGDVFIIMGGSGCTTKSPYAIVMPCATICPSLSGIQIPRLI